MATIRQIEEEAPTFMRGRLFGFMAGSVAEVTVDYADYVIARGFLEAFDEWISGCRVTPKSRVLERLRRHSHRIPEFAQLSVAVVIVVFALQAIPSLFGASASPATVARFVVIFAGGSYILLTLVHASAELIEEAIDSYPQLSYLKLNKGDERIIEEAASAKPQAWIRLAVGSLGSVALGVISAKLEKLM